VPKGGVSDAQLQTNLDYACGQIGMDCGPIQPGGACFEPNTIASHAAYAMNLLYQTAGRNPWNCDFSQTATLSSNNPSKFPNTKPSSIPMLVFLPVSTLGQLIENTTFSYSMGDQLL
jgi:hypothetical protein